MAKDEKKLHSFTSFNSGEYSPSLAGRVDLQSFGSSARFLSNFIPEATGGIKKFYGTHHIAEIENGGQILMVPFYNSYEPMCFVFTPNFIGVILTDEYYKLSFPPLSTSDLSKVRWAQSNDRIFMVAPDMPMCSLNFLGPTNDESRYRFSLSDVDFDYEPFFPIGWTGNYNGPIEVVPDGPYGVISVKIPDGQEGVQIDLPEVLTDATQFNILGVNNYIVSKHTYTVYLGQTTASFLRIRGGTTEVLSEAIVSGSPVTANGTVATTNFIKDN